MAPLSLADLVRSLPSEVSENPFGWGPPPQTEKTLDGVPYAPFSKNDKLGRMADWTSDSRDGAQRGRGQYNRNYRDQQVYGAGAGSVFAVPAAEDESTFSIVDNTRTTGKRTFGRGGGTVFRGRGQRGGMTQRGGRGGFQRAGGFQRGGGRQGGGFDSRGGRGRGGRRFGWKDWDKPQRNRDASVAVRPEWIVREEVDFLRLNKLNLDMSEGEDLADYGFLYQYDRSFDKLQLRAPERRLQASEHAAYNVNTTADPILADYADKNEASVFATSDVLSILMCATRSIYSWDIIIVQHGDKIYFDKRPKAAIDLVSVNENAADAPLEASESGKPESINSPAALSMEATIINHTFALQAVKEDPATKVDLTNPNPFYNPQEETEPLASKGYKYRRFDLSTESDEQPVRLIVRAEVDAVASSATGAPQQVLLRALNEWDPKAQGAGGALDWRTKLVSQRGAVVATEMKNNSCKLARWTTQAILARADQIKLGFVSRANTRANTAHSVLGVISYKPREFASQINLNVGNGWAIVRTVVDLVCGASKLADEEEGNTDSDKLRKYVLVKDPNRSLIRLYSVPAETFEEDYDAAIPEPEVVDEE